MAVNFSVSMRDNVVSVKVMKTWHAKRQHVRERRKPNPLTDRLIGTFSKPKKVTEKISQLNQLTINGLTEELTLDHLHGASLTNAGM